MDVDISPFADVTRNLVATRDANQLKPAAQRSDWHNKAVFPY